MALAAGAAGGCAIARPGGLVAGARGAGGAGGGGSISSSLSGPVGSRLWSHVPAAEPKRPSQPAGSSSPSISASTYLGGGGGESATHDPQF